MASSDAPKRRWPKVLFGLVVGAGGVFAVLAAQVDDWSRDLTTNEAHTQAGAADPELRPLSTDRDLDRARADVREVGAGLPGWTLETVDAAKDRIVMHFVRKTPLLGFADDIEVRIKDHGKTRTLTASSSSRVGKGDLGQNPRNLKELLGALRERWAAPTSEEE